ncbi:MAG: carbohydrate binding family 9 domain-containing protein [Acidobacteria bacterium]|nr:carbohydrate binding family 9 domain-containing protein [Acidobacteriota bacterium]
MIRRFTATWATLLVLAPAPALLAAQDAPPLTPATRPRVVHTVTAASSAITVDGPLDESAWQTALRVAVAYEWLPGDNVEPPERTDCLVTYDREALYVAFRAFDRDPSAIRARLADRDVPYLDDTVGFMIDPFNDERRAFQFRINALGVQMDAVNSDVDRSEDWSWDAIWDSAGRITADGYIVEVRVPFSSLRFQRTQAAQTWGFQATRDLPRSLRHRMRSSPTDRSRACGICQFDKLTGFEAITPGRNLEFAPTVTTHRTDERDTFPGGRLTAGDPDADVGLSARWGLTPNVTMNGALNPDFSQVEADVAQLDVNTRFALSYPEKRPFFLEGNDFFGTPLDLVFTRTIADPRWGAKVTGKEGAHAFGAFVTRDEVANLLFPANQSSSTGFLAGTSLTTGVARYRRDIGGQSTIGSLFTAREGGGYHNRVASLDTQVRLSQTDTVRVQVMKTWTAYPIAVALDNGQPIGEFTGNGASFGYSHNDRAWSWFANGGLLDAGIRADVGFMPRVDTRAVAAGVNRVFRGRPGQWFSAIEIGASNDITYDGGGQLTDRGFDFPIEYTGPKQVQAYYNPSPNLEYFDGQTYHNFRHNVGIQMRPSGALAFGASGTIGTTIDVANGRQANVVRFTPEVEFSLARRVNGSLSHNFQRLTVDAGRLFTANLSEARVLYHFDRRTFLRTIVQYTHVDRDVRHYTFAIAPESSRLFTQVLFSFKLNPQTVLLAGYSDNHAGARGIDLTQTNRTFFMKLGYAWVL